MSRSICLEGSLQMVHISSINGGLNSRSFMSVLIRSSQTVPEHPHSIHICVDSG